MKIENKQALFGEISFFKQNSTLYKCKSGLIKLFIISFIILGILICFVCLMESLPDKLYLIAQGIQNHIMILCAFPLILIAPYFILEKKINEIIYNKISKYFGKDISTNSEVSSINLELFPNKVKNKYHKKALKTVYKINGRYPILNYVTRSRLHCILSCSYHSFEYEICILNVYWEEYEIIGNRSHLKDYGNDYFAVISITGNELNNIPTTILKKCVWIAKNKIETLLVDKIKISLHEKLENKIDLEIEIIEKLIEKAIEVSENIIDNNN